MPDPVYPRDSFLPEMRGAPKLFRDYRALGEDTGGTAYLRQRRQRSQKTHYANRRLAYFRGDARLGIGLDHYVLPPSITKSRGRIRTNSADRRVSRLHRGIRYCPHHHQLPKKEKACHRHRTRRMTACPKAKPDAYYLNPCVNFATNFHESAQIFCAISAERPSPFPTRRVDLRNFCDLRSLSVTTALSAPRGPETRPRSFLSLSNLDFEFVGVGF